MEKCPDKETIERLLDNGLDEDIAEDILSHLSICKRCSEKIMNMMDKHENLLRRLLAGTSVQNHRANEGSGQCFPLAIIMAYASDSLSEDQLKVVENHLEKCDNCMLQLMKIQKTLSAPLELGFEIPAIAERANVPSAVSGNIIEIVLRIKDDFFELIRHTGELLSLTPQLGTVRGQQSRAGASVAVRSDLKDRDISVQITVMRDIDTSGSAMEISVLGLGNETPIPGMDISVSGNDAQYKGETDTDGVVKFCGVPFGSYIVKAKDQEIALVTIEL